MADVCVCVGGGGGGFEKNPSSDLNFIGTLGENVRECIVKSQFPIINTPGQMNQ